MHLGQPGLSGESRGGTGGGLRLEHVVGVEEDHGIARNVLESGVERRGLSAVLLEHRDDPIAVAVDQCARLVGRAVVDDDYLDAVVCLCKRALDRLIEEAAVVVVDDDDADDTALGGRQG